jgi:ribosomal protein L30E
MLLYAENYDVERRLKKINKLAVAGKNTIIQMTYEQLNIINHIIKGQEKPVIISSNIPSFLVKDVRIIEENRNF